MDILADLDVNTKLCSLLTLSCVMPAGLVETFTRLAEAACSSWEPTDKKKVKANTLTTTTATATTTAAAMTSSTMTTATSRGTTDRTQATAADSSELSEPLSQSEAGASKIGSKRARLMVDSCMQGRQVKTSTSTSFLFGRMEEVGRISLQPKTASSSLSFFAAAPVLAMNRTCGICKTVATEPVVARCGHVCCNSCWSKLLKIKPSCPFCNAAVSADQLRQLKIKK